MLTALQMFESQDFHQLQLCGLQILHNIAWQNESKSYVTSLNNLVEYNDPVHFLF